MFIEIAERDWNNLERNSNRSHLLKSIYKTVILYNVSIGTSVLQGTEEIEEISFQITITDAFFVS